MKCVRFQKMKVNFTWYHQLWFIFAHTSQRGWAETRVENVTMMTSVYSDIPVRTGNMWPSHHPYSNIRVTILSNKFNCYVCRLESLKHLIFLKFHFYICIVKLTISKFGKYHNFRFVFINSATFAHIVTNYVKIFVHFRVNLLILEYHRHKVTLCRCVCSVQRAKQGVIEFTNDNVIT